MSDENDLLANLKTRREAYRQLYVLNPMVAIVESFRYAFLGAGAIKMEYIITSWSITLVLLFVGIILFSRIEKTFMDTV